VPVAGVVTIGLIGFSLYEWRRVATAPGTSVQVSVAEAEVLVTGRR
jgi:hypothetical protein